MTYDRLPEVCLDLLDCNCTTEVEPFGADANMTTFSVLTFANW